MEKLNYFIRRFLLVIPTFLGITLLCFALIQFVPGGPVEQIVMQMKGIGAAESRRGTGVSSSISEEQRKAIEAHYGFDKFPPMPRPSAVLQIDPTPWPKLWVSSSMRASINPLT
jgi:ABC-type microcin C transport system permease subunit YejB